MTFDEWWASITEAERKLIGRTTAKYVWLCASDNEREECAKVCEDEIKRVKPIYSVVAENVLKAIRARGNK